MRVVDPEGFEGSGCEAIVFGFIFAAVVCGVTKLVCLVGGWTYPFK